MKTKTVTYEEIVTQCNGENFTHGEVVYVNMPKRDNVELHSVNINAGLVILKEDEKEFTKELNCLFQKFAK